MYHQGLRPVFFKIEKIVGFIIFLIGLFIVLKLVNVLDENLIIPNAYLAWFGAGACILFGFILLSSQQHGIV